MLTGNGTSNRSSSVGLRCFGFDRRAPSRQPGQELGVEDEPVPGLAANVLTPDTLLVLWTTAASFSYWRWHESQPSGERWRWALLLGVSIGLALLTKGTAALVFVAPMVAFGLWDPGPRRFLSRPELWAAALVGTAVGLSLWQRIWVGCLTDATAGPASWSKPSTG